MQRPPFCLFGSSFLTTTAAAAAAMAETKLLGEVRPRLRVEWRHKRVVFRKAPLGLVFVWREVVVLQVPLQHPQGLPAFQAIEGSRRDRSLDRHCRLLPDLWCSSGPTTSRILKRLSNGSNQTWKLRSGDVIAADVTHNDSRRTCQKFVCADQGPLLHFTLINCHRDYLRIHGFVAR